MKFDFDFDGAEVRNGTFLSRNQYVSDVELQGFKDGWLDRRCTMTADQIRDWTAAGALKEQRRHAQ